MRIWTIIACGFAFGAALAAAGCEHKVVAVGGEHQVNLYPDEDTYRKLAQLKGQGGVQGILGGLGENLATKKIDDQTTIEIISKDDLGAEVQVTDGPMKGETGFVARQNLD